MQDPVAGAAAAEPGLAHAPQAPRQAGKAGAGDAEAWLFDAYPHKTRSAIVVWVKHGGDVSKRLVPYQPHFCVKADRMRLEDAERLLADDARVARTWRDRSRLWLRGPEQEVLRVQPKRLQDVWHVATDLRRRSRTKGFVFFDVDHGAESRWMHANGLWSMCRLQVDASGEPLLRRHPADERFTVHYPDPGLRSLRLEVKAQRKGPTEDFADPLESIRIGTDTFTCPHPGDPDAERDTVTAAIARLRELDPDVVATRHGDRFDVPYLLRRIQELGLRHELSLGREGDPEPERPDQAAKSIHTYGRWLFKTHAYYLRGRWHIDLAKKTLDSEDDRKDLHGIVYLARVSNRRAQDVNRNGAGFALQQIQVDLATDWGVALPWKRNLAEDWKDAATLCAVDRGGQIMVPDPGVYEDVIACDFSGYYPSLVVRHNLSSDSLNCTCCPDGPTIPELGYHVCQKAMGHQATVLARLAEHRKWAKAVLRRAKTGN
ncbi:MAG TPA: 3'-5' exonuclease [Candidatus Thermoplasmatota archaeon]|nr:3'-5' exonuclease [Candidatus Thermoplasmatota archaeon]